MKFSPFDWSLLTKARKVTTGRVEVRLTRPGAVLVAQEGVTAPLGFGTHVKATLTGPCLVSVVWPDKPGEAYLYDPFVEQAATAEASYTNPERSMESGSLDLVRMVDRQVKLAIQEQRRQEQQRRRVERQERAQPTPDLDQATHEGDQAGELDADQDEARTPPAKEGDADAGK